MMQRPFTINSAAWWGAMGLVWLLAWSHLATEWQANEPYQYGWSIPLLFVYLIWKRWAGSTEAPRRRWIPRLLVAAGCGPLALGELLRWQDPLWRMTGAQLMLAATLFSAAWSYRAGGSPLLRRLLFPLLFAWTAVPWPIPFETWLTQVLLRFITACTVFLANTLGIAALQHGNAIELSNGVFGIDEACSGIRSLQAAVMASLFIGEFFRLNPARRCLLFVGGWIICIVTNSLRVQVMTVLVWRLGLTAAFRWHDPVGAVATVLSFLLIGLSASLLSKTPVPKPSPRPEPISTRGVDGILAFGCAAIIPLGAWALFAGMATRLPQSPQWSLASNHLPPGWSAEPILPPKTAEEGLRFSAWKGCSVTSPHGWTARVVHLFWKPEARMPGMAFYHTPAMCMGTAGWAATAEPEFWTLSVHEQSLPCVAYRMVQGDSHELVLQTILVAGNATHFLANPRQVDGCFDRLATRWRAPWQQVTEEILVYMPDLGKGSFQTESVQELLQLVLEPVGMGR